MPGQILIILGNGCEKNPELLRDACRVRDKLRLPIPPKEGLIHAPYSMWLKLSE